MFWRQLSSQMTIFLQVSYKGSANGFTLYNIFCSCLASYGKKLNKLFIKILICCNNKKKAKSQQKQATVTSAAVYSPHKPQQLPKYSREKPCPKKPIDERQNICLELHIYVQLMHVRHTLEKTTVSFS